MNKIAFHLGRGANYMHWQIKNAQGEAVYVNPNTHSVILYGCKLKNQASASMKIFKGADKLRCAWVEFESYEIVTASDFKSSTHLQFNPRVCPTWKVNGNEGQDNRTFDIIATTSNQMYAQ